MSSGNIANFQIGEFIFVCKSNEGLRFNQFASATLRGAFGNALKSTLCIHSKIPNSCEQCLIRKTCAYYYLFETGTDSQGEKNPHPFVLFLRPELNGKTIQAGEMFTFTLILVGKGLEFLPYVIYALENLGRIGLGGKRSKFELVEVRSVKNDLETIVYSQADKVLQIKNQDFLYEPENFTKGVSHIKISLITPLRIKHDGKLVTEINFRIFIISLLRRITTMANQHCRAQISIDWPELLKICDDTKILQDYTYWKEFKRYSGRQKQEMLLGGLYGNFEVQGELITLMSFLNLGKLIHVGKSTSFGFGKYKMEILERE